MVGLCVVIIWRFYVQSIKEPVVDNEVHSAAHRLGDVEDQQLGQFQWSSSFLVACAGIYLVASSSTGASGLEVSAPNLTT